MKTISEKELSVIRGGATPVEIGVALALGALAYVAKDVYDNWGVFKSNLAKGWNSVWSVLS